MEKLFTPICSAIDDRTSWLRERRSGIGSSDAAAILGLAPWRSPLSVYASKLGLEGEDDPKPSEAAYWGSKIEPLVINRFREETNRVVEPGGMLLRSRERPWQLATLDASQTRWDADQERGVLEIKCTVMRDNWDDGPPPWVLAQVQHQLSVTGWSWGSVAVLFRGNDFRWLDVERDEKYIQTLNEIERDFWTRIETLSPPSAEPSEIDRRLLSMLYPKDTGGTIELGGEFLALDERRDELKNQLIVLKEELLGIENHFRESIKENSFALLPNGVRYSLRLINRPGYTVEPTSYRALTRKERR